MDGGGKVTPAEEEPQPVMVIATCHTEGCPVDGKPFEVPVYPNPAPPVYYVICGQCSQQVTDIVPVNT